MKVGEYFKNNEREVQTIAPDATVHDAVQKMNKQKIGSCLVVDPVAGLVGIVTERDVLHAVDDVSCQLGEITVESIMSKDLKTGTVDNEIDELLGIMTKNKIRHIPVLDGKKIVGVVSLADLVSTKLDKVEDERDQLRDYIQQG